MKKIIILTLIIIVHFSLKIEDCMCQTGWFSQPLPVSGQVQDLKFIDANTGLCSGIYFYKLVYVNSRGDIQSDTRRMMVIK